MGKPYADDLRLVVVRLIEEGHTRPEVAELCGISLSSVGRVRSTADGLERVVAEDQITLAAEPWTPAEPPPSKTPVRRR